jgi:hypothetical protein
MRELARKALKSMVAPFVSRAMKSIGRRFDLAPLVFPVVPNRRHSSCRTATVTQGAQTGRAGGDIARAQTAR